MKKILTKVASVAVSLLLSASFIVSSPLVTAKAAQNYKEPTEVVVTEAKEEGINDFFNAYFVDFGIEFMRNLAKVDWSVFFSKDYDWKAFFAGDLDTANSKELEVLLGTIGDIVGGINLTPAQSEILEQFFKNKYASVVLEKIIDSIENVLKGDYKDYIDLFNGDYAALSEILDDLNFIEIVDTILESKSDKLNDALHGNYELLKELIDGNYSYLKSLLTGDYTWIDAVINGLNMNIKILFENLDRDTVEDLADEKKAAVLEFVDKYYDQILALCNGDYSYIDDIKDGEYDDMFELFEDVCELVGFEYEEVFGNAVDKIAALDNDTITQMLRTLVTMLYDVLPEEYQEIMDGLKNFIDKADEFVDYLVKRYGDLDDDDDVSLTDVVLVQKNIANVEKLSGYQTAAADVNHDGKVSLADVVLMQRYVARLVVSLD